MIDDLRELNDKVNAFVNYVVKTACERTTSGNYYVDINDACEATGLGYDNYLQYRDLILTELEKRDEILDFNYDPKELDLNCGLDYCPNYQWNDGDEEIFKCSFEEWLATPTKPVSQPLSISRMAEIGESAIAFVVETSDVAVEDLTESIGMSVAELSELGILEDPDNNRSPDNKSLPILFFVNDAKNSHPYGFVSFESAFSAFEKLGPGADKSLSYARTIEGETAPRNELLLKHFPASGRTAPSLVESSSLDDPYIKLAYSKAYLSCYPFDERAWKLRDDAEKALGITDRVVDMSNDLMTGKWRVHIVPVGGHYGQHNALVNDKEPKVEFYDMSADKQMFPDGQFVSSYYAKTLLGEDGYYQPDKHLGLSLYADIPSWTVTSEEMGEVVNYLKESLAPQKERKPSLDEKIRESEQRAAAGDNLSLPDQCYIYVESEDLIAAVRRGESGYYPCEISGDPDFKRGMADFMNEKLGVTKAQSAAMLAGSLFGWDSPGANPKNYEQDGTPINPYKANSSRNTPQL